MPAIRILPEILSNQIAAGEVVERPASVVKELVENSLDAGATHITIEVVKGGKSLIRVSDNGSGLSRDDALLAIERYATSKIFSKEDLFSISTMGFRGEALPSIASVSKFRMVTKRGDDNAGTLVDISGGKLVNVEETGAPDGTMVEVKQLFFNTPARKKFLKSDNTEISHISDLVSGLALSHPKIQFRLFSNQKLVKNFSSLHDPFQRSVHILGKGVQQKLYPIDHQNDEIRVKGFCAHPSFSRSSSGRIFLFVNHRLIYDRGLVSAVLRGYQGRLMKGKYPMVILFLDIPFDQVDVNVHPSKREVKFYNYQQVYQMVTLGISSALMRAQEQMGSYSQKPVDGVSKHGVSQPQRDSKPFQKPYQEAGKVSIRDWGNQTLVSEPVNTPVQKSGFIRENDRPGTPVAQDRAEFIPEKPLPENTGKSDSLDMTFEPADAGISGARILGQVMGTYILIESVSGLTLIDQHAAHERIMYEALKHRYGNLDVVSQNLLVPETIELSYREVDALEQCLEELALLGFIIEPFGDTTFVIRALPSMIDEKQAGPLIQEIIERILAEKNRSVTEEWLEETLILSACHRSVRANQSMGELEIRQLLKDLEGCENPMHCPHGRPTMIAWGQPDLEKMFKRQV